jgi:flavin-binding protein dodecin
MIHMMEVVGTSNVSYSEAVKSAVKKLMDDGHKIYWFETVEQRGAVKGSDIEFQVKMKVAVESN